VSSDEWFGTEKNMKKKFVVLTLYALLFALCASASAQQPGKASRIGYLEDGTPAGSAELLDVFRKQLTQLNWIEGKNLTIEYRYGEGKGVTRLAELAVELVGLKLDLIVVEAPSENHEGGGIGFWVKIGSDWFVERCRKVSECISGGGSRAI
jgi:hypothetical protein